MTSQHSSKTRLLEAAVKVVRTKGYNATRVEDICAEAGVTKGSFFHHFKSKEDLGLGAVAHWNAFTSDLFARAPYHEADDPLDRVLGYIAYRKELLEGDVPEFTCLLGTMVQEIHDTDPSLRESCARGLDGHVATVEQDIAEAVAQYGLEPDWTAESLSVLIQSVLQGSFIFAKSGKGAGVVTDNLDHLHRYVSLLFGRPARAPSASARAHSQ
ncbi:TetR/AcrR family transcriptional regulator [Microbaculum marinum]|uniref:TetR/AcrR family transcriptional regulator n=1 Tax=Microbaculum marinum TaxID=1764581 RepID=A0AAW9RC60_9HYPH